MRILFFPSDLGGGFGHVSRCIALADQARQRGHFCAFVLNDKKFAKRVTSKFPVNIVTPHVSFKKRFLTHLFANRPSGNSNKPLYLGISGLDFQLVRDGLVTGKAIEHTLCGYRRSVQSFNPDLLVGDINLLVGPLSRMVKLPCVQVVRFAFHPDTAQLIWWEKEPSGIVAPDLLSIINPTFERMGLEPIDACSDLLRGDLYVVPSLPEIEPIPQKTPNTIHVGPLVMCSAREAIPLVSDIQIPAKPLIYITIGGGAGPVGNQKLFTTFITALQNYPAEVIISTGGKSDLVKFPVLPANIKICDWVPADRVIPASDLVVFHGGYGTMMETVAAGKSSIVIPFHSEQESNGRRLEQLGCGRVMKLSKEPYSCLKIRESWGEYSYVTQNHYELEASEVLDAVDTMMTDHCYADAAKSLQGKVKSYGGARQTIALIKQRFG